MKGKLKLVKTMNEQLSEEIAVIDEMKHTVLLISRVLFVDGKPIVSEIKTINIGNDATQALTNPQDCKKNVIEIYNDAVRFAGEVDDFSAGGNQGDFFKQENAYMDSIEKNLGKIAHMTLVG